MTTGQLVQNGKAGFVDSNGRPLAGGKVFFYSVGTSTPKDTWQDVNETVLNTNPVILNARGEASIYGTGAYRQVLKDASDVLIWDAVIPDLLESVNTAVALLFANSEYQVNGVVDLLALDTSIYKKAAIKSYFTGFSGVGSQALGGGGFYWDANTPKNRHNGVTIMSPTVPWDGTLTTLAAFQAGTGETQPAGIGCWIRVFSYLTFGMFGAQPVAGFDNKVPFATIETFLRAELAAFRKLPAVWGEPGTYSHSVAPNWGIQGAFIANIGKVKIRCSGSGSAMILDNGATGNLTGMTLGEGTGFIFECGPTATAATVFIRNIYLSEIRCRVWGAGTTQAGFTVAGCVLSKFWIGTTPTESAKENPAEYINGWYNGGTASPGKPFSGMTVTESAAAAQSSYNIFYNWIGAACQFGMYIDSTLGNIWVGGDNEYNTTTGAVFTSLSVGNKTYGMNYEVNTGNDVECSGQFNEFDCDSVKFVFNGGSGNRLLGGMHNQVSILGGTGNYVGDIVYGRGLSGNLVIVDSGTKSGFGWCYQAQSQKWSIGPSTTGAITVTGSPFTFTNNTNRVLIVGVSGGTVSVATCFRGALNLGSTAGGGTWCLSPGDALSVTYSALPTMSFASQ